MTALLPDSLASVAYRLRPALLGWLAVFTFTLLHAPPAAADPALAPPQGEVLLRFSGNIAVTNVGKEAHFDRALLDSFDQHQIKTRTPWTEGVNVYRGPLMREILEFLKADGDEVYATALNSYEARIPMSDFTEHDVLVATQRDQAPMPVREFGPLWLLYPFDHDPVLLDEVHRSRSVWHLSTVIVL